MNRLAKILICWFTGGLVYFYMEIVFRGFSHYSMFICGGVCFVLVGMVSEYLAAREKRVIVRFAKLMLMGSFIITFFELLTGLIVNVIYGLNVWDYSYYKYNFMGQICLLYSGLWGVLSILCMYLYKVLVVYIFEEEYAK